jgi:signal transduction histidine kinase
MNRPQRRYPVPWASENRRRLINLINDIPNLISNAVKHSPAGGVVRVAAETREDRIRISVIDHGAGVPESFRPRIFSRFSQADSSDSRRRGGTGLGLAICKSIVEQHDGGVGFESVPDERTEFYFDLRPWDAERSAASQLKAAG